MVHYEMDAWSEPSANNYGKSSLPFPRFRQEAALAIKAEAESQARVLIRLASGRAGEAKSEVLNQVPRAIRRCTIKPPASNGATCPTTTWRTKLLGPGTSPS